MGTHNKLVRSEDDTVFMMRERICRIAEKGYPHYHKLLLLNSCNQNIVIPAVYILFRLSDISRH